MKSFIAAALLVTAVLPAWAQTTTSTTPEEESIFTTQPASADSCGATEDLCPACDAQNLTDVVGVQWIVTCDYALQSSDQEAVRGTTNVAVCLDACKDAEDCFGVNIEADGTCTLNSGMQSGLRRALGVSNLVRVIEPPPTATAKSQVQITATFGPGAGQPSVGFVTTTGDFAPAPTDGTEECDLTENDLCPRCNNREVGNEGGQTYRILCETELYSDNGTYSVQAWLSPEGCLEECDNADFCRGASYYDDRNCELAKGDLGFPLSQSGYTAFLPVPTDPGLVSVAGANSPSAFPTSTAKPSTGWNATTATSANGPAYSMQPIDPGCDVDALSCPACDGMQVTDKLNGSYTVLCDYEPICDSKAQWRDGADTQEQCMQGCDQDVTCLAVMYWPKSRGCHLCQQGMDEGPGKNLPYVVLAADIDGDEDATSTNSATRTRTSTRRSTLYPTMTHTLVPPTARSITDFPSPFPTNTTDVNAVGPVGPVLPTPFPSLSIATASRVDGPVFSLATTSATSAIHLATSSLPATITNAGAVSCPSYDNAVYHDSVNNGNFAVGCGSLFDGAHSRYVSASNFEACVASCTRDCDGVQFGYTTRCGLYTDISVVSPAPGWTIAASITFPASSPAAATASTQLSTSTALPSPISESFMSPSPNGTVRFARSGMTEVA